MIELLALTVTLTPAQPQDNYRCRFPTTSGWCLDSTYVGNPLCAPDRRPGSYFCGWEDTSPGSWQRNAQGRWEWMPA